MCVEQQCLRYVRDLVCHKKGTFQDTFCVLFHSKPESDLCGSAFMGYVPSPLTTNTAYLVVLICCVLTQCIVASIHN